LPGFGHTPFGNTPFGEWWWSRYVLYELIPSIYRDQDSSGFLEKFSESLRPSFDQLRRKARDFGEMRDPLLVRTAVSEQQSFRLGKQVVLRGGIEQSGVDGKVLTLGEFTSPTARFTDLDRGKELTLKRSKFPSNNRTVTIISVVDRTTVTVTPRLGLDAGLLRWDVRQVFTDKQNQTTVEVRGGGTELGKVSLGWGVNDGFAAYPVRDRRVFPVDSGERTLLTEREGEKNGSIDSQGRLSAPTYLFSTLDVGKVVFISGSLFVTNNGRFEIYGVDKVSPTDYRAVFSRLDLLGTGSLGSGTFDSTGTLRYANNPLKTARVQHLQTGLNTPLSVSVSGEDITVTLGTDGFGNASSTALAVAAAVTADPFASPLVTVVPTGPGTGVAGPTDGFVDIPGSALSSDANLTWALSPYGWLVLEGPVPKGLTTSEGTDGYIQPISASEGLLKATTTALFRPEDVGRLVVIRGSLAGNDGTFVVKSVPAYGAGTTLTIDGLFGTEPVGHTVNWELRTKNGNAGFTEAVASAPSMIVSLAKDFGIEIDTQESEARQRSWVKHVNQWIDKKGLAKAYEILAAISGYSAIVSQPFNITYSITTQLPSDSVFEITDSFGSDASVSSASGIEITVTTPTGFFTVPAVGKYMRLQDAASGANNQLYEVVGFFGPTSLRLRSVTSLPPVSPDANNGALRWSLVRLYTNVAPLRPNFDDFDSDAMNALLPGFVVDSYCWEQPIRIGSPPKLNYDGQLSDFSLGEIITGQTSGATAVIEQDVDNGASGVLNLSNVVGVFLNNELIQGNVAGNAFADGSTYFASPGSLNIVATAEQTESSFVWVDGDIAVVVGLGVWSLTDILNRVSFLETLPLPVKSVALGAGNSTVSYVQFDPAYAGTPLRVSHVVPIKLNYTAQIANFTVGEIITGQTSLATATIVADSDLGATGTLTISGASGPFTPGEQLLGNVLGDATAFGTQFGPAFTSVALVNGLTTDIIVTLRATGAGVVLAPASEVITAINESLIIAGLVTASPYPGNGTGLAVIAAPTLLASNGVFRTAIATTVALTRGPAVLEYLCEPNFSCDYCISYRVLLQLELDTLFDDNAVAFERIFERTLARLEDVTPAHVELVPLVIQPLVATLNLTATIEPVETLAILFAPLSFYFDDVPPDDPLYEVDSGPYVTITTTITP